MEEPVGPAMTEKRRMTTMTTPIDIRFIRRDTGSSKCHLSKISASPAPNTLNNAAPAPADNYSKEHEHVAQRINKPV